MARSDTFTVACSKVGSFSYYNNFTLYVELTDRDGDPGSNTSTVEYKVYCSSSGSGSLDSNHQIYFELDGEVIVNKTVLWKQNSPYIKLDIASGTKQVSHENKTHVSFGALIKANSYGVSASIGSNFELEYIPRYSEINSFSIQNTGVNTVTLQYAVSRTANIFCSVDGMAWGNPIVEHTTSGTFTIGGLTPGTQHSFVILVRAVDSGLDRLSGTLYTTTKDIARIQSANNFNIGETPSMTYTAAPAGCSIKAYLERITGNGGNRIDSISETKTVSGTSCTFTYDKNWLYSQLSGGNSAWCRYCLVTVCNGVEYLHYVDRQYFVTNSNPIFSNFEYQDINENIVNNLTGDNQTIVKGFSNVQTIISVANKAQAINGATMKEYRLSIGEKSERKAYSDTEDVAITINAVLSNKFTIYAVDSRENSTPKEIMASNYIEYQNIAIKTINATRKNNVLPLTTLNFNGVIWDGNFGLVDNEITECHYRYKKTTEQEWTDGETDIKPIKSGNGFSFSAEIVGDLGAEGFDIDESFEIQVFVADKLSNNYNNPATFILGPGTPAVAIYKNKVAIGGRYDTNLGGALQISGKIYQNGQPIEAGTSGDTLPIGSVVQWTSDTFPENWLKCNGQEISRTEYPELFSVLGTAYGAGDGSTTFNVPDLRARVPVGKSNGDANFTPLGKQGGYTTQGLMALIGATDADSTRIGYTAGDKVPGRKYNYVIQGNLVASEVPSDRINHATPVLQSDGSTPTTIQPYTVVNFIIKAKQSAGLVATIVDNLNSSSTIDALSANQGRVLAGEVLFDNASGQSGTIELNETVANFRKIIVQAKSVQVNGSCECLNPDGKVFNLVIDGEGSTGWYIPTSILMQFNGKILTILMQKTLTLNSTTQDYQIDNSWYAVKITKVLGYR